MRFIDSVEVHNEQAARFYADYIKQIFLTPDRQNTYLVQVGYDLTDKISFDDVCTDIVVTSNEDVDWFESKFVKEWQDWSDCVSRGNRTVCLRAIELFMD